MPTVQVNGSSNIQQFGFKASFDIYNRKVLFDTEGLTEYIGNGKNNVAGICFLFQDQEGVTLLDVDWNSPTIIPSSSESHEFDMSSVAYQFLFQTYKIIGYIKDSTGTVYQTTPIYKKVCQPKGIVGAGYVPGVFQLNADCANNVLTVKDLTLYVYNSHEADNVTKDGKLYYPTGTIAEVSFTGTPFTNDQIYTGQYRITNTAVATYDLGDDFYVDITYSTNAVFDVTCQNKMADVLCCIEGVYSSYVKNCDNAIGAQAKQLLDSITIPLLSGMVAEMSGADASKQADEIKEILNCDCGCGSIKDQSFQNSANPINPAIHSILLSGECGTEIGTPVINGNTKTFPIKSKIYQVVKADVNDLAFSITQDTTQDCNVKYKIKFNYATIASYVLNNISGNNTLITQLNSLISATNFQIDLSALNGKCIIDLSSSNYFLSYALVSINDATPNIVVKNVTIDGSTQDAPANLLATNPADVENWLNSLSLGTFSVSVTRQGRQYYINILSVNNTHTVSTMVFTDNSISPVVDTTVYFQKTNKSIIALFQAIIDYLCSISALYVNLGRSLVLCQFDYNGNVINQTFSDTNTQDQFNVGIANAICNLANRIYSVTALTCNAVRAIFQDNPNAVFDYANSRVLAFIDGACVSMTGSQLAMAVIASINANQSVKSAYCAIDCSTPGTCPDVSAVNVNMNGSSIGVYGVTWNQTPSATQSVTVKYRKQGTTSWLTATSNLLILPNGNLQGTTPYDLPVLDPGQTYQVWVYNNCGGTGFVTQITTPTGGIVAGSYLTGVTYSLCGSSPITLYSATAFGAGVRLFTDPGLVTPATGYSYIADANVGDIFTMNPSTAYVGTDTALNCSSGTEGYYTVTDSGDPADLCTAYPVKLFSDGAFGVGKIMYVDKSLSTPLTGYNRILNSANNHTYILDNVTGNVVEDMGLLCSNLSATLYLGNTVPEVCAQLTSAVLYFDLLPQTGSVAYTDSPKTTRVTGYQYIGIPDGFDPATVHVFAINPSLGIIGAYASDC